MGLRGWLFTRRQRVAVNQRFFAKVFHEAGKRGRRLVKDWSTGSRKKNELTRPRKIACRRLNQEISAPATWLRPPPLTSRPLSNLSSSRVYFVVGHFWGKLQPRRSRYGCLNTGEMDCAGDKEWKIAAAVISRVLSDGFLKKEKKKKKSHSPRRNKRKIPFFSLTPALRCRHD